MTPQAMVAGSMILGTVILVPLAFVAESPLSLNPSIEAISAMVAIGALTGTGFSVYFLVMAPPRWCQCSSRWSPWRWAPSCWGSGCRWRHLLAWD